MKQLTVMVTGGAGFIGSHLVEALVDHGEQVIVVDNFSTGRAENLAERLDDRVHVATGSVLDYDLLDSLLPGVSTVYHLAAIVGVDRVCRDPFKTLVENINGTKTVLDVCEKHGAKAVVASTSEIYGKNPAMPLREGDDTVLGPTTVKRWSYALSKLVDEYLATAFIKDAVILRYFNCYGPRLDPNGYGSVIARFIDQALKGLPITVYGDGRQSRSFTYIDDTVEATVAAGRAAETGAFNIGQPDETDINHLAAMVRDLTGSNSEIVHRSPPERWGAFGEARRRLPDVGEARRRLGFEPKVKLADGLSATIAWMRGQGGATKEVA